MNLQIPFLAVIIFAVSGMSCDNTRSSKKSSPDLTVKNLRNQVDTIGFAQYPWQMDSIVSRMNINDKVQTTTVYKAAICPHDDYAYAAGLYNQTLSGIKAKTIIMIGVAHKARNFNLENTLIFGSYTEWKSPYGEIKVSELQEQIVQNLAKESYRVHDSMMQVEHSLEAITPFLKMKDATVEIIPILIPYMTFENMKTFANELVNATVPVIKEHNLHYGEDLAVVISNDAIHYGNEDWGGADLAPFGIDDSGNQKAREKDLWIIKNCLEDEIDTSKIRLFNEITINKDNFKEYAWTWCGRYAVPFGLLFANELNLALNETSLSGFMIDYRNSLQDPHINVSDLQMGHTAPAKKSHWVAYAGIGYQ